jgi:prolipoprotein diacylglyceryl transferase
LSWSEFSIGSFTVHAYALFILSGIFFALWLATRRWVERGGNPDMVAEVSFWAIPFGIVGGRIYHVISSPAAYFGANGNPVDALKIWEGGLGIWGAVAFGAVGAYIGARRHGVSFVTYLDVVAPAVLIAQAIGRLGNYFNHELFGAPTTLPWGLAVDPSRMPISDAAGTLYHPTFLYEVLWNLAGAALLIYLDRRWNLRGGRVFWLYVVIYTTGRLWIEALRIDPAVVVGGLRINVWVSIVVLASAIAIFVWLGRRQRAVPDPTPREQLAASLSEPVSPAEPAAAKVAESADAAGNDKISAKVPSKASSEAAKEPSEAKATTPAKKTATKRTAAKAKPKPSTPANDD